MGKEAARTKIRQFSTADIVAVSEIDAQAFVDAWGHSMWLEELANSLATYLVLECDAKVIGYAGFWLVAGEAQITRVAIDNKVRVQGWGSFLTKALVKKAWELGANAITLEVRESNLAAQKTYLKCGFINEGIRPNYYADNHEDAVIMWLYKEENTSV